MIDALPTMREIVKAVCARHRMTFAELTSPVRARVVSHPRQEAMYLIRMVRYPNGKPKYSFPQIARFLGLKDHTTVMHGVRAYMERQMIDVQKWESLGTQLRGQEEDFLGSRRALPLRRDPNMDELNP